MILCFVVALAVQDAPVVSEAEAAKIVDEIAAKPAIYHQTCEGLQRDANISVAVTVAGPAPRFELQISSEQFAKLRRMREGAVKALTTWAEKLPSAGGQDDDAWADFSRTRLAMIVDLNATATLPALRRTAEALKTSYDASGIGDTVDWGKFRSLPPKKQEEIMAKVRSSERLGDVLSTMIALLRQEKFEPLIASSMEKELQAVLAARMQKEGFTAVTDRIRKAGGKVAEDDKDVVIADPVSGAYVTLWVYPQQKLDAATVKSVFAWVDEFAKRPADQRRDAKGMHPWPVNR